MAGSRVATLLLLSLRMASAWEEAPESAAAFAGDDECAAGGGGEGCGLNALQVKVLSYNLFWWSLFGIRGGNGNSAGKLIEANMETPFDVMGFQECEGGERVVGGMPQYKVIQGPHAICMAYNAKAWSLLEQGTTEVAEDMGTRYYGVRGTQWVRLQSQESNDTRLFFVNHHGPLSVNSGGQCGGEATAYNLMNIMAQHAQEGDLIVLVGDFNANAASLTIQTLWANMVQAYAGKSFGGVDNIFTNADAADVVKTKNMGSGGSDHEAIYATIQVGGPRILQRSIGAAAKSQEAAEELTGAAKPGWEWTEFWCGRIEDSMQYAADPNAWSETVTGMGAADPEHCCRECQASDKCASWLWKAGSRECVMSGAAPISKTPMDGFVSGLAYTAAAAAAAESAKHALTHMM